MECLKSGPLGGSADGVPYRGRQDRRPDLFWDPMLAQPHDVDVKALLRISNLYNIPTACNVATANCACLVAGLLAGTSSIDIRFFEYTERSLS